jgi:hypothetical protein
LSTYTLDNGHIHLETLATAGPRVTHLSLAGRENMFADLSQNAPTTSIFGDFRAMGGHRLWHAPEAMPRTYIPDNDGLTLEELPDGVRLAGPIEAGTSIAKTVEIHLAPGKAAATLTHTLCNHGLWDVELAPWALSMFRLEGIAILPQPVGNTDAAGLLHNRILVIWPYTRINDPRLVLRDDFILIRAAGSRPPVKIGYYNTHGWMAYWLDGVLFRKTFDLHPGMSYPDGGCNAESYCGDEFIELETLAPLARLAPGASAVLTETWELFGSPDQPFLPAEIQAILTAS